MSGRQEVAVRYMVNGRGPWEILMLGVSANADDPEPATVLWNAVVLGIENRGANVVATVS